MQRQQVHALRGVGARVEAAAEVDDELGRAAVEDRREGDETREVRLTDDLALAELVGQLHEPARVERRGAHRFLGIDVADAFQPAQQTPRGVALEQRRALERDVRVVQ